MQQIGQRRRVLSLAAIFALSGAAARAVFQLVETRWQIATFVVIALTLDIGTADGETRRFGPRFVIHAACATAAIVAVKWHLEGVSPMVRHLLA
ncbi:hypothetical protein [Novosphingobium soli]|uniref:Uncharacterized protein n=1 Tax=Novosphingobium soli TaxID=574956 RepID=A0ABV6CWG5_9SPHN